MRHSVPGKMISGLFLFFFPFSLLLLTAFPFLSLDSWRGSRWLLFLWLHTGCNGEGLQMAFQVARYHGGEGQSSCREPEMFSQLKWQGQWQCGYSGLPVSAFFPYPPQSLPCSTSFQGPACSDGRRHTKPRMSLHSSLRSNEFLLSWSLEVIASPDTLD